MTLHECSRAGLSVAFGDPLESSQPQIVASVHRPLIGLAEMSSAFPLSNFVGHDAATITLRYEIERLLPGDWRRVGVGGQFSAGSDMIGAARSLLRTLGSPRGPPAKVTEPW